MKLNTKKLQETKVITHPQYPNVKVTIRPFSLFALNQIPSSSSIKDINEYFTIFNYVVLSWEGINDENDKRLQCNEVNKRIMFDSDFTFASEIVFTAIQMRSGLIKEEERKNLQTSPTGEEQVSEK